MNPSQNPSAIRSKNEITAALLHLMKELPYAEITAKQIILESMVSRKTFYRNYDSKDDVLKSYIHTKIDDYVNELLHLSTISLSTILDTIFMTCVTNKTLLIYLYQNQMLHILLYELNDLLPVIHKQIVSEETPLFSNVNSRNIDYLINFNIGAIYNILVNWLKNDMEDDSDEIKKSLIIYIKNVSKLNV